MLTPITAPVKAATKAVETVTKPISKVLAPVGDVVGKVAAPVASVAGTAATVAGAGAMFFPPLAGVAAAAETVSMGAGIASTASKMVDSDPNSKVGLGDVMSAVPMLNLFP